MTLLIFIENLGIIYGFLGYFIGSSLLGLLFIMLDKKQVEYYKNLIMNSVRSIEVLIWGRTWDKDEEVKNVKQSKKKVKKARRYAGNDKTINTAK